MTPPREGEVWIGPRHTWRCLGVVGQLGPDEPVRLWEVIGRVGGRRHYAEGPPRQVRDRGLFGDRYVASNWRRQRPT